MQITSDQDDYDFSKQLRPVTMLKKRFYLRCLLGIFANFT